MASNRTAPSELELMSRKIDEQERRVQQRDLKELREQCEESKRRQLEIQQVLSMEQARCRTQEREIDRRRKQLEESTELIKGLQSELEETRRVASGVKWELRENELRSLNEAEVIHYRSINSGLEAKLRRKQSELELAHELLKNSREVVEKEVGAMRLSLRAKDNALEECRIELQKLSIQLKSVGQRQQLEVLGEKIGTLTAVNENLRERVEALQKEKAEVEERLRSVEEDRCSLRAQIESLKGELTDTEGTTKRTNSYLSEELEKCKHQKAALRCEHLQLKRDCARLEVELKISKAKESSASVDKEEEEAVTSATANELKDKCERLEREMNALAGENRKLVAEKDTLAMSLSESQRKLESSERSLREMEACESARIAQMAVDLEDGKNRMGAMREALVELDDQCERLMSKLRGVDSEKKGAQEENHLLRSEIEALKRKVEDQTKLENEWKTVSGENARLLSKVDYLERELEESHSDHRAELASLAKRLSDVKSESVSRTETTAKVNSLASQLRLQESECRSLERKLEQFKKEAEGDTKEIVQLRKRQCELINENTSLRQMLCEAIKKAEDYKTQTLDLKKSLEETKAKRENDEKMTKLEDQVMHLGEELAQREKLVGYLQSVVQPKQMQKIARSANSSHSTLISSDASSEIESEARSCDELGRQRDEMRRNLQQQRKILVDKQNEAVPLIRQNRQLAKVINVPSMPQVLPSHRDDGKRGSPAARTHGSPGRATPFRLGTMRHDIPHRWRKQFITITSASVVNTCGLPEAYANHYLDAHSTASVDNMTGWVKMWRSDDQAGNKWRNAWAQISKNKLAFYDSDNLAVTDGPPFMSIDLANERWRIFNQHGEVVGVPRESMPLLIEIKLPSFTLYLLAPTAQARQRWVKALQLATTRRISADIQRRNSSAGVENTLLLALMSPQNLTITSTQVLDNEWLLMGTQEGLFATHWNHPRAPFNIANISSIYYMELIPEHEMLIAICGSNRRLVAIHLQQLRRALTAEVQPSVQCTPLTNIDQCHLAVVSKQEHSAKRFIYLATGMEIHILQFLDKLGAFAAFAEIRTEEPCICICSTSSGFIFGADNFHFVGFNNFASSKQLAVEGCPSDYPVAALEISSNEYLLAFSNYGVFVTADGRRSRRGNVEWEKMPLEFEEYKPDSASVYAGPSLFVVYRDFLEVCKVATYAGSVDDSATLLADQRSLYKCNSAHFTGVGAKRSDAIFVLASDERTELHVFNDSTGSEQEKSSLKRKLVDTLNKPSSRRRC